MTQRTSKYPPKTLVNLTKVEVFAATFVDGSQVSDTRLVAKIGNNIHFLHPEGVDNKIKQLASWLRDAVLAKVGSLSSSGPIDIPDNDVSNLPMGSE
jgi:hypothetical protein